MSRLIAAFAVSLTVGLCVGPGLIFLLKKLKARQNILCYVEQHKSKQGVPTMGGLLFIFSAAVGFFLFSRGQRSLAVLSFVVFLTSLCHVKSYKLRGEHNKFNLLAALTVGNLCGVRREHMLRLIKEYALLPNRIEYVLTLGGISFYNDSKGTNVHACMRALESMDGRVGLILGGSSKKEDFCEFFENIDKKVTLVAVTGGNADLIYNAAMKMGFTEIRILPSLAGAVNYLYRSGEVDTILLSPACASFDRYKSYVERGEKFKEAVYALQK